MEPEHPKFHDLRQMLRDTKDFQGFLYNYREMVRGEVQATRGK